MSVTSFAVNHRATTVAMVVVSLLLGISTFVEMPRHEDPEIIIRAAVIVTSWPGATAEKVEELVTDPLETAIAQMDEVEEITSLSKVGVSIITVELIESLPAPAVDQAWDDLRAKVMKATAELPDGTGTPVVNSDFDDVFAVSLALYQHPVEGQDEVDPAVQYSYRELEVIADQVEDALKTIEAVAKVEQHGVQNEVVYLEVESDEWAKIDITAHELAQLLDAQNIVMPGGEIDTGEARYSVRPTGEFEAVEAIRDVVVGRRDGTIPIALRDLPIAIKRTYIDPPKTKYRLLEPGYKAERCIMLAVSMKSGENLVAMGEAIERKIAELKQTTLPHDIRLSLVNDLPRQVDRLVDDFTTNLLRAIAIVLTVAFLMIGWRPAVIMATAIPLSMIAALSVVSLFGVELEQFSIASLIIALGMIVDNAIVVSENSMRLMDEGMPKREAVIKGATSLAVPILTSTLTTVAAFGPMLLIVGNMGEYVRSLPIVVATTLLVSYIVAMTVTPTMCFWLLRPKEPGQMHTRTIVERIASLFGRRREGPPQESSFLRLYDRSIRWALTHQPLTLGLAGAAVAGSFMLVPLIGNQFFPLGDRDQFFVDIWLPEGSSIHATEDVCAQVEGLLLKTRITTIDGEEVDRLSNLITFVGTGGPRIMLTSNPEQDHPNYAFMVVNTTDPTYSAAWVEELRQRVAGIAGARIDVQRFMLGPPIKNPIEVRLIADDPDLLRVKAEELIQIVRDTPGTLNPRSNWENPSLQVEVEIDSAAASLAGVTNVDVADTMNGLISGRRLTTYREGDHLVPVFLRMASEERRRLSDLSGIYVNGRSGKVPLASLATVVPTWQPTVIARRNQRRTVTVGARVRAGYLSNSVAAALQPKIEALMETMPPGSRYEFGGELEESIDSQKKLARAFTLSVS